MNTPQILLPQPQPCGLALDGFAKAKEIKGEECQEYTHTGIKERPGSFSHLPALI